MESTAGTQGAHGAGISTAAAGNGRAPVPPPGTRSAEQIRRDIVAQRGELSRSVDALRHRWVEVTDVKSQLRKHKSTLLAGAAVAGLAIGAVAIRRRRRR
jgi:hypothetical protein